MDTLMRSEESSEEEREMPSREEDYDPNLAQAKIPGYYQFLVRVEGQDVFFEEIIWMLKNLVGYWLKIEAEKGNADF